MHPLAMSGTEHTLWVWAVIIGFVVVLAVAALLSLLIYAVKIIDRRVVAVRDTLQAAAANTAETPATRGTAPREPAIPFIASSAGGPAGWRFPESARRSCPPPPPLLRARSGSGSPALRPSR